MAEDDLPVRDPVLFDAVLVPNRSLAPLGFALLMGLVCTFSFAAGVLSWMVGAWPVIGFLGLDVLLIYVAFRVNFARARAFEIVRLTERELAVERVSHSGRRSRITFNPYWLRVEIDDPPEHWSQLRLTSHGRSLVVGAFLSPHERTDFARALSAELGRLKEACGPAASPS